MGYTEACRSAFRVKVTHIPTGITASCDLYRHMYQNRDMAMKLLRSRLWASKNLPLIQDEVAIYDLPEESQYPNELAKYRAGEK